MNCKKFLNIPLTFSLFCRFIVPNLTDSLNTFILKIAVNVLRLSAGFSTTYIEKVLLIPHQAL